MCSINASQKNGALHLVLEACSSGLCRLFSREMLRHFHSMNPPSPPMTAPRRLWNPPQAFVVISRERPQKALVILVFISSLALQLDLSVFHSTASNTKKCEGSRSGEMGDQTSGSLWRGNPPTAMTGFSCWRHMARIPAATHAACLPGRSRASTLPS